MGQKFGINKNQVSHVLKDREEIKILYINNSNERSKHVKIRKTKACEIDTAVIFL